MATRFVSVSATRLLDELREISAKVVDRGGISRQWVHGREIVVDVTPPHGRAMVRVYTSLASGAQALRAKGKDAVRVMVCVQTPAGLRTLEQQRRLLRTAPAGPELERERAFLARLRDVIRAAYAQALDNPPCPVCGKATADRHGKFRGCSTYPQCTGRLAARVAD